MWNESLICVCFVHQDFQLNRVLIDEGAGAEPSPAGARPKKKNRKTYDLTAADKFWQKHKGRSVMMEDMTEVTSHVVTSHNTDQSDSPDILKEVVLFNHLLTHCKWNYCQY